MPSWWNILSRKHNFVVSFLCRGTCLKACDENTKPDAKLVTAKFPNFISFFYWSLNSKHDTWTRLSSAHSHLELQLCFLHKTLHSLFVFLVNLLPTLVLRSKRASRVFPRLHPGAPIVVSFPHFYQADPAYINAVDGLNPNEEEHETYLDLQPVQQTLYRWLELSWTLNCWPHYLRVMTLFRGVSCSGLSVGR